MEKVHIEKLDDFAKGVTRIDNKICFVDKALPLEDCEIEIVEDKKNYSLGIVKNIIKESNYRIMPLCPYYDICGGCHLLHYDRQSELIYKEEKVLDLLNKFAKIEKINLKDIKYGNEYYYRNKITLHGDKNKIGLYQEKTNKLIEIDECLICSKKINEVIEKLNKFLANTSCDIKKIIIRSTSLNQSMLIIDGDISSDSLKEEFSEINSIYVNKKLIFGKEYIEEKINDLTFLIYPDSFFQVNYEMMKFMYNKVIDFYKENPNLNVLDLYCGTGTMSMLISKYCNSVVGIEINEDAIKGANECKKINKIENINFYLGKVEDKIDDFKDIGSIIVDPPRSGLDKHTINSIININPKSIIYISCDPATLARDLNILKENYNVLEITPVDMFPNTYHCESITVLERK